MSSPAFTLIEPHERDLGSFTVRRLLPSAQRQAVGPFIFFDELAPSTFPPGQGMDVRPHPHIGLATVTYLFEGEIYHRDSLGYVQPIHPGDVNWMTAGKGIVHSERTGTAARASGITMHGIQSWVALPQAYEEVEPSFHHHAASTLPILEKPGITLRVIAGSAYGLTSPVRTYSPLFYVAVEMRAGSELALPEDYPERAVYLVEGQLTVGSEVLTSGKLAIWLGTDPVILHAQSDARVMLLGGEPLDGQRYLWWNFVSSSEARIEQAKQTWLNHQFPKVPGETEFIPLPQS
ncbi:MAG: pirin family protein [Anaerolineae bacterium]|nr:pirin family protein [Gloeobacterales cyanobacterium ES-bin-313]